MAKEIKAKKIKATQKKDESLNERIGYCFDLDSFEWLDKKLTAREKLFVYYVASTNGANLSECARKAGYSKSSATDYGCRKNLELKKEIDNFREKSVKISIAEAYNQIVEIKRKAAMMNTTDFYNYFEEQTEDGRAYLKVEVRRPDELTDDEKQMIKGVHFNARGIPEYEFMDKEQNQKFIIDLYNKQNGQKADSDEFNVETTAELIKDKMIVQTKVIKRNKDVAEMTDFKEKPEDYSEED